MPRKSRRRSRSRRRRRRRRRGGDIGDCHPANPILTLPHGQKLSQEWLENEAAKQLEVLKKKTDRYGVMMSPFEECFMPMGPDGAFHKEKRNCKPLVDAINSYNKNCLGGDELVKDTELGKNKFVPKVEWFARHCAPKMKNPKIQHECKPKLLHAINTLKSETLKQGFKDQYNAISNAAKSGFYGHHGGKRRKSRRKSRRGGRKSRRKRKRSRRRRRRR